MEPIICQLCREPIWNFLCVDCLSKDVKQWLPTNLSPKFAQFHQTVKGHFHTTAPDNYEPCLNCSLLNESPICPHCYTHETFHWLKSLDKNLAAAFSKIFFFYKFEGYEFVKSDALPITEIKNEKRHFGHCDGCGECSDELLQMDSEWYCEDCRN